MSYCLMYSEHTVSHACITETAKMMFLKMFFDFIHNFSIKGEPQSFSGNTRHGKKSNQEECQVHAFLLCVSLYVTYSVAQPSVSEHFLYLYCIYTVCSKPI